MTDPVYAYCVRDHNGLFLSQPCAWIDHDDGGRGGWTPELKRARIRLKLGTIRTMVTKTVKNCPNDPVPQILRWELDPATATVVDDSVRAKQAVTAISQTKLKREQAHLKWKQEDLQKQQQRISAELAAISPTFQWPH